MFHGKARFGKGSSRSPDLCFTEARKARFGTLDRACRARKPPGEMLAYSALLPSIAGVCGTHVWFVQ